MNAVDEMKKMLDAQDIERELKELKIQADLVSAPLERTRARRHMVVADLDKVRRQLDSIQQQRRQVEAELADADARAKSATTRQSTATSTREVSDLEKMLEQATAAISNAENTALELMEREDELSRKLAAETEKANREMEKIDTEVQRLSGLLKEKQEMAKALREERITALNRMEEEVRENYEWLVNKHGAAQAVAASNGGACGGCGAMLLPDQLNKVKDPSQLYRCTHCYRYLLEK